MDEIMSGIGNDAESRMIEASSIVSIGDGTRGWLTTLKDPWSDEWASSFFVEPFIFGSSFTDPGSLESSTSRDQTYSRLGAILPQRFWEVATALAKSTQRGRLYVSIDPLTPPIALGLWADPLSGLAVWQAFDVLYCNDIACGLDNLEVAEAISNPATLDCFVVCDPLGDLDMARSVPLRSSKVIGNFGNDGGSPATRAELLELLIACGKEDGIFVYQGHSAAGIRSRPGSAALVLETTIDCREIADLFTVEEIIRCIATSDHETRVPRRMVLLSCASGQSGSGYDATSLASAFIGWGARYVICSLISIPDDGSWTEVTEAACEVLRAPDPARMFSSWQSIEIARASDESWRAILESLVLFSAFTADAGGAR
jgi:hypothetical protein